MPRKPKKKAKRRKQGLDLSYGRGWISDQTPIPRYLTFNISPLKVKTKINYINDQNGP